MALHDEEEFGEVEATGQICVEVHSLSALPPAILMIFGSRLFWIATGEEEGCLGVKKGGEAHRLLAQN